MGVLGKTSVNLAELASTMESQIQTKLPIVLRVPGIATQATLFVSLFMSLFLSFFGN